MQAVINFFRGLFSKEEGQTLAEYALILVLIAVVVIVAVRLLGVNITAIFNNIAGQL